MILSPFYDETIESFLIRVSLAQKLPYRYFAESVSLPGSIKLLDLFHTQNKAERLNLINSLENKLNLPSQSLCKILTEKSDKIWGDNYTSYQHSKFNFPAVLYRKDCIPICPLCLKEEPYIRVGWHFQTSFVCLKHKVKLVFKCPNCLSLISYLKNEIIDKCYCGANLMNIPINSNQIDVKYDPSNKSILGTMIFFKILNDISASFELNDDQKADFDKFQDCLNSSISSWLVKQLNFKKRTLIKRIEKYSFNEIWGGFIMKAQNLPTMSSKENKVLKALRSELKILSENFNLPALVTVNEASVLLNKSPAEIKRDIGEGKLIPFAKTLRNYVPIIDLRDVSELL